VASIKDYLNTSAPSSTGVHSNIDNLILQSELDKRQFGGVSYYKGKQEFPIDMVQYSNLMSKANMSSSISELKNNINKNNKETLKSLTQEVINRMKLGDAPMGIVAYRTQSTHPKYKGYYKYAVNPLYAPDTIRLFNPGETYSSIKDSDYQTETLLHEPLHAIRAEGGNYRGKLSHKEEKGFTQNDFNRYEQSMLQSLSNYFGGRKKAINEARKIIQPIGNRNQNYNNNAYIRRFLPYNPMEDIFKP
tara:strand:- start:157 stop:897 length:741 start_codon:yes stop_codon:yes gene_type:complete